MYFLYKQIGFILPLQMLRGRDNVVRTSVSHSTLSRGPLFCFYIPRCDVICASITEQTTAKWNLQLLRGESFLCHVFSVKIIQNLRTFWRQHYCVADAVNKVLKCIWELRSVSKDKKIIIMKVCSGLKITSSRSPVKMTG